MQNEASSIERCFGLAASIPLKCYHSSKKAFWSEEARHLLPLPNTMYLLQLRSCLQDTRAEQMSQCADNGKGGGEEESNPFLDARANSVSNFFCDSGVWL